MNSNRTYWWIVGAAIVLILSWAAGSDFENAQIGAEYHQEAIADAKKAAQLNARELRERGYFETTDSLSIPVAAK